MNKSIHSHPLLPYLFGDLVGVFKESVFNRWITGNLAGNWVEYLCFLTFYFEEESFLQSK